MAEQNTRLYQHILLAIDLHPESDQSIIARALSLAKQFDAKISLVHAVIHINAYGIAQAYPVVLNLEEDQTAAARLELQKVAATMDIPAEQQYIEVGSPKAVIIEKAQQINADLIIVGSHGRHGISLLLGSTANAVLHHANCDVLAVRV